ncbi:fatty acyl-CoA reductase 2-like isoform X2 [Anoplolepis gracilipes]
MSSIPFDDREAFSIDLSDADIEKCIRNGIIGVKKYLLHEDMNRLDAAKTHCKRVDQFVATFKTIIAIGSEKDVPKKEHNNYCIKVRRIMVNDRVEQIAKFEKQTERDQM